MIAFVDELFIKPSRRGRGIGTQTLGFIEAPCRVLGIAALHLGVDHQNFRAHAAYRTVGFADHDRYLMTKWLAR